MQNANGFDPIAFGLQRFVGWCHDEDDMQCRVVILTTRTVSQEIPGGARIISSYHGKGKEVNYIGDGFPIPEPDGSDLQWHLLSLARFRMHTPYFDFTPRFHSFADDAYFARTTFIVAYREREAAIAAYENGYRVKPNHHYEGAEVRGNFFGKIWKELSYQKPRKV